MQVHIRLFADKEQSAASTQPAVACPLLRCLAVAARALAIPVMQWKNELVGEIGAAFLCCYLEITPSCEKVIPHISSYGCRDWTMTKGRFLRHLPMRSVQWITFTSRFASEHWASAVFLRLMLMLCEVLFAEKNFKCYLTNMFLWGLNYIRDNLVKQIAPITNL